MNAISFVYTAAARKRFDELCRDKNALMPIKQVTRVLKTKTETYQIRDKFISDGSRNTGMCLISEFAKYLRKMQTIMPENWLEGSKMPAMPINNESIAKLRSLSSRTIRTHIRQLKAIGFITDYVFHGTKANFEVSISSEILFGNFEISSTESPSFSSSQDTKLPHKLSLKNKKEDIESSNVEVSVKRKQKNSNPSQAVSGFSEKTPPKGNFDTINAPKMETRLGAAGGGSNVDKPLKTWKTSNSMCKPVGKTGFYNRLSPQGQEIVHSFWLSAQANLYQSKNLTSYEVEAALDSIAKGVYMEFFKQKPSEHSIEQFHQEQLKCIEIAAGYYEKNDDKYCPMPFAVYKPGTGYFDSENENGFKKVNLWRTEQLTKYNDTFGEKMVYKAIMHLKYHKKGKAPKHLQCKTYTELYRFYEVKIRRFGETFLNKYYSHVSTLLK